MPKQKTKKKVILKKKPKAISFGPIIDNKEKLADFRKFICEKAHVISGEMIYGKISLSIDYVFDKGSVKSNDGKGNVVFSVDYAKSYRSARLTVYLSAYEAFCDNTFNNNSIIDALVHEFCHIHTIPLHDLASSRYVTHVEMVEASEELTESMAIYVRENLRNKNKKLKLYN